MKKGIKFVIVGVIALLIASVCLVLNSNNQSIGIKLNPVSSTIKGIEIDNKLFDKYPDYLGVIEFDSGLVKENFVQGPDNDYYLFRNMDGKDDYLGTPFVDMDCNINSQNVVIYGHYVYTDESLVFSPLKDLKSESNYKKNEIFKLYLKNEVRTYKVAYVYYLNANDPIDYMRPDYSSSELKSYLTDVKNCEFYNTGLNINDDDKFVTLQTCVRNRDDLRLVVIGKLTDTKEK